MGISSRMWRDESFESMVFSSIWPLCAGHRSNVRVFHFEEPRVFGSFNSAGSNGFEYLVLGLLRPGLSPNEECLGLGSLECPGDRLVSRHFLCPAIEISYRYDVKGLHRTRPGTISKPQTG